MYKQVVVRQNERKDFKNQFVKIPQRTLSGKCKIKRNIRRKGKTQQNVKRHCILE